MQGVGPPGENSHNGRLHTALPIIDFRLDVERNMYIDNSHSPLHFLHAPS